MSNTVKPTKIIRQSGSDRFTCVVIPMRPSRFSVGILNADETEARFPWDWDEQDKETALRIAGDYARGFYTEQRIQEIGFYTMPYPIQRS